MEYYDVTGTLLVDGAPAESIPVTAVPTDARSIPEIPKTTTDKEGRFTLRMFKLQGEAGAVEWRLGFGNAQPDDKLWQRYNTVNSTVLAKVEDAPVDLGNIELTMQ